MTTTKAPARTDRYGFPIVDCRRCAGTGQFGPSGVNGGRCFKCGGGGLVHPKGPVADAWTDFVRATDIARHPQVMQMSVGDEITFDIDRNGKATTDATWKAIARIGVTPDRCGSCLIGTDESKRTYQYYWALYFTDGTHQIVDQHRIGARRGVKVTARPFLRGLGLAA